MPNRLPRPKIANHVSSSTINHKILASPKAKRLAREQHIDLATLTEGDPTAVIIARDILNYKAKQDLKDASYLPAELSESHTPSARVFGDLQTDIDASALLEFQNWANKRSSSTISLTDIFINFTATVLRKYLYLSTEINIELMQLQNKPRN